MRETAIFLLMFLVLPQIVAAQPTDNELDMAAIEDRINSIAHYAEEYEIGNINYFQLNVYGFQIRSDLNMLLGGGIGENWAQIPKENIEKVFGTPADYTDWVWVDNLHMNKRLDEKLPWWERIVFDGKKIRIVFHSFPSAIDLENGSLFKYYSVDLNVQFKKTYDIDINSIFNDLALLAAEHNRTRTTKSGEAFVQKMLDYERLLGGYFGENIEQCEEIMSSFFTPDEKAPKQKTMTWKVLLYSGSDFDVLANVDACEDCVWHHVSVWLSIEGRGPSMSVFESPELRAAKLEQKVDVEYYWTLNVDEVNRELKKTILEVIDDAKKFDKTRSEDFPKKFFFNRYKAQQISRLMDGKYNGVEGLDESIGKRIEKGELTGPGNCKELNDCRMYCSTRENIAECRNFTYWLRVDALEEIFSGYRIEKTPADQLWWERQLFENSAIYQNSWCRHTNDVQCAADKGCVNGKCIPALGGNETCNNKIDDDGDNLVDCQDPDCYKEKRCGKLCEKVCNKEGGCWQTSQEMCAGVCKECWDCGGDENCKSVCEPACWPCHNQAEVKNVCDACWTCNDEAYGGCYVECKTCDACNTNRKEKMDAIFERAARGEITTPGNCMSEEECKRYCAGQKEGSGCWSALDSLFNYPEFDCNDECRDCTRCNYDLGNFQCNANQHFDRDNSYCVCNKGYYDCDGIWDNGCESARQCNAGPCLEECRECDACGEGDCQDVCLGCYKCRNPERPTYVCDGVEQLKPCEPEYVCNGVKQKKPCNIYVCDGREYTKPCDEANITCGKNQILTENECACREGFKDCDGDGNCEPTKFCGLEICDDSKDNNGDGMVDCSDATCNRQVCGIEDGKELLCISRMCIPPEKEAKKKEPEPICGNHICEINETESCQNDCVVCETYEPPECPDGKIVWKGKDNLDCPLPPICVVTKKACEVNDDCPQPKCGVSECIAGECKVTELLTVCEEGGCKEGKTKTRACKDGSEITTAVCSANKWVKTEYDCPEATAPVTLPAPEVPVVAPEVPEVPPATENVSEEIAPEKNVTEEILTEVPSEEIVPEVPEAVPAEEIAPEVEKEAPEACDNCMLESDCGSLQDVCSNGNCVTLPIPVEKSVEKEIPPGQEKKTETPPRQEKKSETETPPESGSPATGGVVAGFADVVTGLITGLVEGKSQCRDECKPCDECNQEVDKLMRRMEAGEFSGPNNCRNRVECDNYCQMNEHKDECENFFRNYGLKTFYCWQDVCRDCDKCKFTAGELTCNANQQFNMDKGFCECAEGWFECDGDWETGCESQKRCDACMVDEDCAKDRCAPWGNVVQQFACFQGEERMEIRGAVRAIGTCRFYPTKRMEGGVGFDMWGEPFEELYPIKEQTEREMGEEWCSREVENNIKERIEIQNSFTNDFLKWFFEEYVSSSPSEWEQHIGGLYDSYWRIVNNDQAVMDNLLCTGKDKLPEEYKPIDVSYDTEFGSVRIWEVKTTTDFFGKRTEILSPYMQIWVFPPKEFMKKQFQEAMESGAMPGPGGAKPESSPSEIEEMKKDKKLMDMVNSLSSKYGGEAKFLLNIVDGDELVFNALITINPDILIKAEPMKTYTGDYDAKLIFDFDFFYSLISTSEKEIRGGETLYPPWESGGLKIGDMIKGFVDGVKMWFMINSGAASGDVRAEPSDALSDGLTVMKFMFERSQ
jgi:hypothetical protein